MCLEASGTVRVLYLLNYAGAGGIEKYVENLVRLGPGAGIEPYFAYSIAGPLCDKLAALGVPALRLSLEWKDALRAAGTLAEHCRREGIEVIHTQCPRENIIALLARRRLQSLRVVFTDHFTRRVGLPWRLLYRHFTPENHRCIAVCRESREVMLANGVDPSRLTVIYNGIEPGPEPVHSEALRRELGVGPETLLLLCVARFTPEKGLPFLIRSLAALRAKTERPFCCAVAGEGEQLEEIKALIAQLGLEREVRLLGYRRDVPELMAGADLFVCPSESEALSFAVLEAMGAALSLVLTDAGANRELAETEPVCGTVVPYGDADAFAGAVLTLLEDEPLRRRYAAAARRKAVERFDLRRLALDVFQTYHA